MKINKILKKGKLYELTLSENKEVKLVKVTEDFMLNNKLLKPRELTKTEQNNIDNLLDNEVYYIKCLNKIKVKIRSTKEIKDLLKREGCDLQSIDFVIGSLTKFNHLNDKNFAMVYFDYLVDKKKGPGFIINQMRNHNINSELYSIENYSNNMIVDNLNFNIKIELKKYKKGSINNFKIKCLKKMLTLGFEESSVIDLLDNMKLRDFIDETKSLKEEYEKTLKKYSPKLNDEELNKKIIEYLIKKGYSENKIKEYVI